eukprot:g2222.t1
MIGNQFQTLGEKPLSNCSTLDANSDGKLNDIKADETKQKKRALKMYLNDAERKEDVVQLIQDSEFVVTEIQSRQKIMTEMRDYDKALQLTAAGLHLKKKKHKKLNSKIEEKGTRAGAVLLNGSTKSTKTLGNKAARFSIQNHEKSKADVKIKDLIENGLLTPGKDIVSVIYKGTTYLASLDSNGKIIYKGSEFAYPSAFSVHVKRILAPNKKGDDGWNSVMISGQSLSTWRTQYLNTFVKSSRNHNIRHLNEELDQGQTDS